MEKKEIEEIKSFIKENSDYFTYEHSPTSIARYLKIAEHIDKGKILDVGCGRGIMYLSIKDKPIRYLGLEKKEKDTNLAKNITNCEILNQDICQNTLKKGFFDYIIISEVLEHAENPLQVLKECKFLLKDDGKIIGTVPNSISALRIISALSNKEYGHSDTTQIFSTIHLKNLINFAGLKLSYLETFFFQLIDGQTEDYSQLKELFPLLGKNIFFIAEKESS